MHWWDLNTKSFGHFSANSNNYRHAFVEPQHNIFLPIFEKKVILIDNLLVGPQQKILFSTFANFPQYSNLPTYIGETLTQSHVANYLQ